MSEDPSHASNESRKPGALKSLIVCGLILAVAAGTAFVIFSTEPTARRETATRKSAMLVEVASAERGDFRPTFVETGTVMAAKEINLAAQIDGLITETHPSFVPGGFLDAGEIVVAIEADDYENALRQRRSELQQARTELALEQGRRTVAEQDLVLLDQELAVSDTSLVLREPQMEAARVRVESAEAAVDQAELNLRRTKIRAPFDAQIISREVNLGSQIGAGDPIARLVGTDAYWVMATVALAELPFLSFGAESEDSGSKVRLRNRSAWPPDAYREGRLLRLVGALDPQTRLARVVVEVPDPLLREAADPMKPRLLLGEFLEVRLNGETVRDAVRVRRDHLRKNDTVWVMDDENKLRIREPQILLKDAEYAYLLDGVDDGERVVTSTLATVAEGADLRAEATEPAE